MDEFSPLRNGKGLPSVQPITKSCFVFMSNHDLFTIATSNDTSIRILRQMVIYLLSLIYPQEFADWSSTR